MSALLASSIFIVLAVVPVSLVISTMAGFAIGSAPDPGRATGCCCCSCSG